MPAESTAHKAQPIGNGTLDSTNKYPFAGAIVEAPPRPGVSQAYCSAVLLTPVLVASAGHCPHTDYSGSKPDIHPTDTFWVVFSKDLIDFTPDQVFKHSDQYSGDVHVMSNNWGDRKKQPLHDIALFTLDRRVPASIAKPMHPPGFLGVPGCHTNFTGTNIGYGDLSLCNAEVNQYPKWGGGGLVPCVDAVDDSFAWTDRTYATNPGWHFEAGDHDKGGDFRHDFTVSVSPAELGAVYQGSLPGDSGGPLIRVDGDSSRLCGTASTDNFDLATQCYYVPYYCVLLYDEYTRYTALDHGTNRTFIEKRAKVTIDGQETWLGKCPPGDGPADLRDVDSDGDYIPDACDPCPYVKDQHFHDTGVMTSYADKDWDEATGDFTGDGVPDICDNCPPGSPYASYQFKTYNPYQIINGKRVQPDSDGDGLGDACDRCNHSELRAKGDRDHVCCTKGDSTPCGNPTNSPYKSLCVQQAQADSDPTHACAGTTARRAASGSTPTT